MNMTCCVGDWRNAVIDKIADQNRLLRFGLRLDGFITISAAVGPTADIPDKVVFLPIKTQADAGLLGFSFLSSRRSILPTLLFGSSDLNSTCFGTLYGVNCVPAKLIMS